ncbi:hypothetical protein B0A54_06514 [Friedmanniomyces endolithicus]|uniref:Uncharacterized protein n=1 Tax=Friedmanniomyces endolithicus TaxID=329885 RepID=A0A4U0V1T9_9PEZI|nr:hypothetical protein B0A54_06514 [Friedmanniomyces endolithicus]
MPGGRTPKNDYDWDDKKDVCYQLFVVEKKSINEIITHFANHFGVAETELPSARLFRRQFTDKWHFPPRKEKRKPEDEAAIVERMRQLWEQNMLVAKMQETLDDEGWGVGLSEFQKLRRINGFTRRVNDGAHVGASARKRKRGEAEVMEEPGDQAWTVMGSSAGATISAYSKPGMSQGEATRRANRLAQIQFDSDNALLTRRRRRRIRNYGHLPPDAPNMAPRYNTETTLDECKAFLHLNNDMYTAIRQDYEVICRDMGIERKKTFLSNGMWQASKDRLVRENMHLSGVMHPLQPDLDRKATAVDVICSDVTKRMRDQPKRLTVADANNGLGLNPSDSKELRKMFYGILDDDQFTTRLACGDEHWNELRLIWNASSPLLQQVMAEGDPHKIRCVDVLCRDATKRRNDDYVRKGPNRREPQQRVSGPGPGSARAPAAAKKGKTAVTPTKPAPAVAKEPKKTPTKKVTKIHAKKSAAACALGTQAQPIDADRLDPALSAMSNPYTAVEPLSIPVYFRLSPQSQIIGHHPRLWLGKLTARTVSAVHQAATSKAGAAQVTKVHGLIKNEDESEDSYLIEGDEELDVYLGAAGEKASFLVVLEGGYA